MELGPGSADDPRMDTLAFFIGLVGGPILAFVVGLIPARRRAYGALELLAGLAIPLAALVVLHLLDRLLSWRAYQLVGRSAVYLELGPIVLSPFYLATVLLTGGLIFLLLSQRLQRQTGLLNGPVPQSGLWLAGGIGVLAAWLTLTGGPSLSFSIDAAVYAAVVIYGLAWPQLRYAVDGDEQAAVPPWWTIALTTILILNPAAILWDDLRSDRALSAGTLISLGSAVVAVAALGYLRHRSRSAWSTAIVAIASGALAGAFADFV